jgi:adenosylmethionine-8-amino-7-oxononanoate aminotransferase
VGHAATIVQPHVFEGFYGEGYDTALMHGPTFMGNALACSIALAGIELIEQEGYLDKINAIERQLKASLLLIQSSPFVKESRVLGAIGVLEMADEKYTKGFTDFAKKRGVWLRPFLSYIYTMPPYVINPAQLQRITDVMQEWVVQLEKQSKW